MCTWINCLRCQKSGSLKRTCNTLISPGSAFATAVVSSIYAVLPDRLNVLRPPRHITDHQIPNRYIVSSHHACPNCLANSAVSSAPAYAGLGKLNVPVMITDSRGFCSPSSSSTVDEDFSC